MQKNSKWQLRLMQFMRGRYGFFDLLGKHLLLVGLGLMVLNLFIASRFVSLLTFILIGVAYYRLFSKRLYIRTNENQRYQRWFAKVSQPLKKVQVRFTERKKYRYYKCPSCRQEVRVPTKRGKINITCPKCKHQFIKKT